MLLPVSDLLLCGAGLAPLALPARHVGELKRRGRQLRGPAGGECAIERGELLEEDADRPAVDDDVVQHHEQDMVVVAEAQQAHAEQRRPGEIERHPGFLLGHELRLSEHEPMGAVSPARRVAREILDGERRSYAGRRLRPTRRACPFFQAKLVRNAVVPAHDLGEAAPERADVERALQPEGERQIELGQARELPLHPQDRLLHDGHRLEDLASRHGRFRAASRSTVSAARCRGGAPAPRWSALRRSCGSATGRRSTLATRAMIWPASSE